MQLIPTASHANKLQFISWDIDTLSQITILDEFNIGLHLLYMDKSGFLRCLEVHRCISEYPNCTQLLIVCSIERYSQKTEAESLKKLSQRPQQHPPWSSPPLKTYSRPLDQQSGLLILPSLFARTAGTLLSPIS
jgi:hypothetical protein